MSWSLNNRRSAPTREGGWISPFADGALVAGGVKIGSPPLFGAEEVAQSYLEVRNGALMLKKHLDWHHFPALALRSKFDLRGFVVAQIGAHEERVFPRLGDAGVVPPPNDTGRFERQTKFFE